MAELQSEKPPRPNVIQFEGVLRLGTHDVPVKLSSSASRIAIVGPSGVGKTSLLRALAGLSRINGTVRVGDQMWEGPQAWVEPWKRGVGWVPQDPTLFPHRSVAENLTWSAVNDYATPLGLVHLLHRRPRRVSGGERQRVALGRGLAAAQSLVLLDEPFSALDEAMRERVASWLLRTCGERELPLILVSHDTRDVAMIAEETYQMTPQGLVHVPARASA